MPKGSKTSEYYRVENIPNRFDNPGNSIYAIRSSGCKTRSSFSKEKKLQTWERMGICFSVGSQWLEILAQTPYKLLNSDDCQLLKYIIFMPGQCVLWFQLVQCAGPAKLLLELHLSLCVKGRLVWSICHIILFIGKCYNPGNPVFSNQMEIPAKREYTPSDQGSYLQKILRTSSDPRVLIY